MTPPDAGPAPVPNGLYHPPPSSGMEAARIRRARLQDLPALAKLFDAYRVFYKRPSEPKAAVRFLRERFRKKDSILFVAQLGHELVGFTQVYPTLDRKSTRLNSSHL